MSRLKTERHGLDESHHCHHVSTTLAIIDIVIQCQPPQHHVTSTAITAQQVVVSGTAYTNITDSRTQDLRLCSASTRGSTNMTHKRSTALQMPSDLPQPRVWKGAERSSWTKWLMFFLGLS